MNNWSLIDHLTNHLARPRWGEPKHPTLWPSEASAVVTNKWGEDETVGKCRRASFFRFAEANYNFGDEFAHLEPLVQELKERALPTSPYLYWLWSAGELYEDYVIALAKDSGVFLATQVPIYLRKYNMSGKLDLVTINPENFTNSITEVKSVYGHGGNVVLGTQYERKSGLLGKPRDGNLMQIALYDWHFASPRDNFEDSRLLYGSRDTGRYAEYRIRTEEDSDGTVNIFYRGASPNITREVQSPITINSILDDGYAYVTNHLLAGLIPEKDYELEYSEEKIQTLYERDKTLPKKEQRLTKKDREQIEKIAERKIENELRMDAGKKELKPLKPVQKGDWLCGLCKYKEVCYNKDASARSI